MFKNPIRLNIYIEILKYAASRHGFTIEQLMDDLNFNVNERNLFTGTLIHGNQLISNTGIKVPIENGETNRWVISMDGRFKLLEYEEMEQARESAKKATHFAIAAIVISAIAAVASLGVQLFGSVRIDDNQINKISDISTTHRELPIISSQFASTSKSINNIDANVNKILQAASRKK